MHCFSFDIETIPDVEFGRRMWDLGGLSDEDVASAMFFKQQQKSGSEFLPLHQHRIVAISVALRTGDTFRLWSLGEEESDEAEQLSINIPLTNTFKDKLRGINEALARIEAGTYGVCENCGKEISMELLEIDPESKLCKTCKAEK